MASRREALQQNEKLSENCANVTRAKLGIYQKIVCVLGLTKATTGGTDRSMVKQRSQLELEVGAWGAHP